MSPLFRSSRTTACASHAFVKRHARWLTKEWQWWPGVGWHADCRLCSSSLVLLPAELPHLPIPSLAGALGPHTGAGGNLSPPACRPLLREEGEVFIDTDPTIAIRVLRAPE